jgi:ankyrin repeat protein
MLAAEQMNPNPDVILVLLRSGARINESDAEGRTPLMFAAANNRFPVVASLLIKMGARVNDQDENGLTPLMHAARYGVCSQTISVLLKAGAAARAKDAWGETALDLLRANQGFKDSPAYDQTYNELRMAGL